MELGVLERPLVNTRELSKVFVSLIQKLPLLLELGVCLSVDLTSLSSGLRSSAESARNSGTASWQMKRV